MAINYLNTVNLNKNSLESARIHNLGTEPTPDTPGEIYFNTTSQALKVTVQTGFVVGSETYAWEEVGSDSVIAGTGIVITPGTGADAGNSVITNSGLITLGVVAGAQNWTISNGVNTTTTFASADANEITVDSPAAGTVRIGLPADVTISNDLAVSNDMQVDGDFTAENSATFNGAVSMTNNLGVTGTVQAGGLVTAAVGLSVTGGVLNAGASTTINLGANRVTNIADPTAAQDAATKAYVDDATVGGLVYQGAYNPVTNTPDLDRDVVVKTVTISQMGSGGGPLSSTVVNTVATTGTGQGLTLNITLNSAGNVTSATVANGGTGYAAGDTVGLTGLSGHSGSIIAIATIATAGSPAASIGIEKGWTYTVVADGDFYGEQVRVGDVLIAESDDPGDLVNWTTVQNNIDLASAAQVGIGNVAPGEAIDVSYSSGTATVSVEDSAADNKGAVIVAPGEGIDVSYSNGTATVSGEDSAADNKGIVIVAGGTGISVAYSGGTATVSATANGARQDLLSSDSNVTRTESGGLTTFALDVGAILGSTSALNVKAEIISAAGQTVYADITRSGTTLNVIFTGSVADSAYQALLIDLA